MKKSPAQRRRFKTKEEGLDAGWFYSHLYRFTIHLIWNGDGPKCATYIKREFDIDLPPRSLDGRCIEIMHGDDSGCAHVIFLRKFDKSPRWISVLSHECFHAVEQIMAQRNIQFRQQKANESYAYLHEFIMEECLDILYQPTPNK